MPFIPSSVRCLAIAAACFYMSSADADCVDTVGLNAAERDFYNRANSALKSFLPPAPPGENTWSADSMTAPQSINVCKGDKKPGDFTVEVQRKYIWPDPKKHFADTAVILALSINARSFDKNPGTHSGAYGSPSPTRSADLKVHNVTWNVSAGSGVQAQGDSLRASITAAVDRERLQRLVGRPLPTAAESEAMAKKLPPTPLITPAPAAPAVAATTSAGSAPAAATQPSAAPPSAPAPASAPAAPTPTDTAKEAIDTVQKIARTVWALND